MIEVWFLMRDHSWCGGEALFHASIWRSKLIGSIFFRRDFPRPSQDIDVQFHRESGGILHHFCPQSLAWYLLT